MGDRESKLYHFIGIKGSGMSSLVSVLHQEDYSVQGSDIKEYFFIQWDLKKPGVPILSLNTDNIDKDMTVIAGNTFPDTHEGIARAIELGAEVIHYHDFIARSIESYANIAVTGLHGKTSTTGLLVHVLSGINPTSYLVEDGTSHGEPNTDFFVFEACEYRYHFLAYSLDYAITTNIDFNHPDYHKDIGDVFSAFQTTAHQVKKGVFAYGDDKYLRQLGSEVPAYHYGVSKKDDIQTRNIQRATGGSPFDAYHRDDFVGHFVLPAFGHHNIMNTLGVTAVAYFEKLNIQKIAEEMLSFKDIKRRLSEKKVSDMIVVDDYAHHPAKVKATVDGARQKYPDKEIVTVFQPYTFTRTAALMGKFAEALGLADEVSLCSIFGSARETRGEVRIEDLGEKVQKDGQIITKDNVLPLLDFEDAVVVFMGAGDVQKFEQAYETLLSNTTRSVL